MHSGSRLKDLTSTHSPPPESRWRRRDISPTNFFRTSLPTSVIGVVRLFIIRSSRTVPLAGLQNPHSQSTGPSPLCRPSPLPIVDLALSYHKTPLRQSQETKHVVDAINRSNHQRPATSLQCQHFFSAGTRTPPPPPLLKWHRIERLFENPLPSCRRLHSCHPSPLNDPTNHGTSQNPSGSPSP